jgi:pimeloyl-ACP methyl ester carboxylesterase
MYGREDPWVRPIWGIKVKKQVPEAPYYEISPAGHCPHDEVPEVRITQIPAILLVLMSYSSRQFQMDFGNTFMFK